MGRGKLSMELIKKERTRMVTYQKRKMGLMKKAYEFSTLCGVDTCVIVFGPKLNDTTSQEVETWPPTADQVGAIINKYRSSEMLDDMRRKNNQHLSDFFAARKTKVEKETKALRKKNMETMFKRWDARLEHWSPEKLRFLGAEFEAKLEAASHKFLLLKGDQYLAHQQLQINIVKQQLQQTMELQSLQNQQQQQQSISYMKPVPNMSLPGYYNPIDQTNLLRQPFGFSGNNQNNSTMMMMPTTGKDASNFQGNTSTGYIPFTPLNGSSSYYDPSIENMFNNPRPLSVSDYDSATNEMPFFDQNLMSGSNAASTQMQTTQFSDFLNLTEHGVDNGKNQF